MVEPEVVEMLERLTWIKESTYRWAGDGLTVYIDVWGAREDPVPADVIFITHAHYDHFDLDDLAKIRRDDTVVVAPRDVAAELSGEVIAVTPGETVEARGVKGETVPAYNIVEHRLGKHPKENGWVGYVLDLGGTMHYFSGDTDHLPELDQIRCRWRSSRPWSPSSVRSDCHEAVWEQDGGTPARAGRRGNRLCGYRFNVGERRDMRSRPQRGMFEPRSHALAASGGRGRDLNGAHAASGG